MRFSWVLAVGAASFILAASVSLSATKVQPPKVQVAASDRLFKQYCAACHAVVAGKASTVGPNLKNVLGRTSGATAFAYSPAMKRANIKWTTQNLDRFLAGPGKMVPGSRMAVAVPNAAHRAEIILYLASVK